MQLPGFGGQRDENNGLPNPTLWKQRNIAGTQDLLNQEGDGVYPYGFFFQPPGIPASTQLIPWSGLPPAGGFIPYTPFMLPVTYFVSPSFVTNWGNPGAYGTDAGGGGIAVTLDDGVSVVTVDNVGELDFSSWTPGLVYENPAGSGVVKIDPPTGTGTTGNLTVNSGDTPGTGTGPLVLVSGSSFSGNITIGIDYDTVNSFDSSSSQLQLKSITTTATVDGTDELVAGITTDGFGRITDFKKIAVDVVTSFEPTLTPNNELELKAITYSTAAAAIPDATMQTGITVDGKGRVTAGTTREIGLFAITKADRVAGEVHWTYTMRRLYDSDSLLAPITAWPFTEDRGATSTSYNTLEVTNTTSYVYGGSADGGLPVLSVSGIGPITLDSTYLGFNYGHVPIGMVVLAIKEGNVNAKWWFSAPNTVYGSCPEE
jgi:hypothetical protein